MIHSFRWLAVLLAVPLFLAAGAGRSFAQTVIVASPPAVMCYSAPAVSYYAPPTVSYYSAPAVFAPTVTTYRYGLLPRRVAVTTYGAPAVLAPVPVVRYYSPVYVIR